MTISLAVLVSSVAVLLYLLVSFAHARVLHADLHEIERLYAEGVMEPSESPLENFRAVCELLNSIAPAIYMRQEFWIRLYYYALWLCHAVARGPAIEREITRLTAYQAAHYRIACVRLAAIR